MQAMRFATATSLGGTRFWYAAAAQSEFTQESTEF